MYNYNNYQHDNNQLKLFKYNILYKDWCVNQLTLFIDQPNIQMIVRNKLYNILKVRIFYPPTINELTNQSIITSDYFRDECMVFINNQGVVFKSCYEKLTESLEKLYDVGITRMGSNCHLMILLYYLTTSNKIYPFSICIKSSELNIETLMINDQKIILNDMCYTYKYKSPKFTDP